jgi:hypothetical protein
MGQNAPCRSAASAASALSAAFGCTSVSGRCRQTYRRSPEVGEQCPYDGLDLATVEALEVAVLHQGHLRIRRAADVVAEKPQYWVTGDANQGFADREASVGSRPVDTSRWATSPILVWVSRAARRSLSKAVIAST